jgi:uncharacterized protein DUF4936
MASSFYVYYRVAPDAEAAARGRAMTLLERVRSQSGINGRLLRKRGEAQLWMEVYENVHDDARFEAILSAGAGELAFEEVLQHGSSRRVECFEDFNPCA